MKLKKDQLKEILKESILELLSEGNVEIKLSNNINLVKKKKQNITENFSKPIQNKKIHNPNKVQENRRRPAVKVSTGNPMFDELINTAKSEGDMLSDQVNSKPQTIEENMDYSNFVDDMHR